MKADGITSGYAVVLPRSRIVLNFVSPPADPDFYILELQNTDRVTVGAWDVIEPDHPSKPEDRTDWALATDLYTRAHQAAAGWDAVLSDVKAALQRPGAVGAKAGKRDDDDDNIPF